MALVFITELLRLVKPNVSFSYLYVAGFDWYLRKIIWTNNWQTPGSTKVSKKQ
ncbi:MAG TPA: hypothetical protein VLE19_00105 [Pyrinomonadaceae bacterium]|nr:hypothetical protein [Pyrinomonadaceae bacterium]